jgi:hypothetical protein
MRGNLPLSEAVKKAAALKKKILQETGIRLSFEMRPWPGKDAEIEAVHAVTLAAALLALAVAGVLTFILFQHWEFLKAA